MSANGAGTVVISWPHVPIELVYAARLRPHVIRGDVAPTPLADARLEAGLFPNRIRQLVEAALDGRLTDAAAIVLPRTSEADYKAYLYLREFARQGVPGLPQRILLMDLLQSEADHVAAHNAGAARRLAAALSSDVSDEALREQIVRVNRARAAVRRLVSLRAGHPRVTGTEVLPLIAAFWTQPPETYAVSAAAAADDIDRRPALEGPRVLLMGAPVDGPGLHAAIESHGAVVVAETGPWGSDAAGEDVDPHADPFAAIAGKYQHDISGPRTPMARTRAWVARAIARADSVVVSLPADDGVCGWDYPWLRDLLRQRGVPHVCVTGDPVTGMTASDHAALSALIREARPRLEARRG